MQTRSGQRLWSIPYPQEVNDIPMIMARQMDGRDFADLITDNFEEMRAQAHAKLPQPCQPLVMGIALHPYIMGHPYRLRHLRRALEVIAKAREAGDVRVTTPGAICRHVERLTASQSHGFSTLAPRCVPTMTPLPTPVSRFRLSSVKKAIQLFLTGRMGQIGGTE